jgi:hypothetical protein
LRREKQLNRFFEDYKTFMKASRHENWDDGSGQQNDCGHPVTKVTTDI